MSATTLSTKEGMLKLLSTQMPMLLFVLNGTASVAPEGQLPPLFGQEGSIRFVALPFCFAIVSLTLRKLVMCFTLIPITVTLIKVKSGVFYNRWIKRSEI